MNLTSIKLSLNGAHAWASVTGPLTSGMVGIPVTIEYDDAWDGLTKNLVCRCSPWNSSSGEIRTILNVGETTVVAHEVMQPDMYLHLGVEGFSDDGKLVMPTTWARCGKIEYGANTCEDPSTDPELSVWNQLQIEMEQTREYVLTPEQAVNIQAYAQTATQAAQEAKQAAEEVKQTVESGLYYIPSVSQPTDTTLKFEFKPSITGAPIPKPVTVTLSEGSSDPGENVDVFSDKAASFYGDSTTEENWHYTKGYHKWVKELLDLASYSNFGVSGYKISDVIAKVNDTNDDSQVIFVKIGVNDVQFDVPLGSLTELASGTIYGDLNILCEAIRAKYPARLVVFITPAEQTKYPSDVGVTMLDVRTATMEVCARHAIPVFDHYVLSGICVENLDVFTTDGCHLNDIAHEVLGRNLAAYMRNTFHCVYSGGDSGGEDETTVPVTGVSLNATSGVLTAGESVTLTATVAPDNATNKSVSWESSAPSVATVSGGVVVAVASGSATITATTEDGSFTAEYALTVEAESDEDDSTGFVGKTMRVTGYHSGIFDFTAIIRVDDDAKLGDTVEFRVSGADCENLTDHTAEWMQLFGDDTGICSNSKYVGALSDGTAVTATISDSNELSAVATYSINAAPTTEYMKVCIPLAPADTTQSAQFTIDQISATVNSVEKPIIAIGGFFTDEIYEII